MRQALGQYHDFDVSPTCGLASEKPFVEVRIGIKPDAQNIGGVNLFGEHFGNYPQSIVLKVDFLRPNER